MLFFLFDVLLHDVEDQGKKHMWCKSYLAAADVVKVQSDRSEVEISLSSTALGSRGHLDELAEIFKKEIKCSMRGPCEHSLTMTKVACCRDIISFNREAWPFRAHLACSQLHLFNYTTGKETSNHKNQ